MKTLAAIIVEQNKPLELMELEVPNLEEGQVLVEVKYTGICRTQVNEIKGYKGKDHFLPHTLGHEGSGVVLEVGAKVTKVKKGDHVVLTWIKGEGLEYFGTQYQAVGQKVNSGPISTFLKHAVISENRVISIGKDIPLREAALFGCAIPTGAGIVYNELALEEGATVAIFGLGGIGLSSLLAARMKGAKQIIAVDREQEKLDLAKALGATETLLFNTEGFVEAIHDMTEGKGVDYSIEAAGNKLVMETAFEVIRPHGKCVLAGNVPHGTRISCDPFDFIKGKQLVGTWGGNVKPDQDIPLFLSEFMKDRRGFDKLISHEIPLEEINTGIEMAETGKAARIFIRL